MEEEGSGEGREAEFLVAGAVSTPFSSLGEILRLTAAFEEEVTVTQCRTWDELLEPRLSDAAWLQTTLSLGEDEW